MKVSGLLPILTLVATVASTGAGAAERTWYIYCEGRGHGMHWAVISRNSWTHPESEGYARRVASRAETFFETRHRLPLEGCSGVDFMDSDQANLSRERTDRLHRRMGDRVHYIELPPDLIRE